MGRRTPPFGWIWEAIAGLHNRDVRRSAHAHERPLLDAVRWVSAAAVAIGHAMGLMLSRQAGDPHQFLLLNYLSDLRAPAVMMFFVISGYLVGGSVLLKGERFRWRPYVIGRFTRIYIVLVPALLLLVGLDGAAYLIDPHSPVYTHPWPSGVLGSVSIFDLYEPINWFVTFFSLESVVAPPLGSGTVLWSLGYEWVFYFIFPLLLVPFFRSKSVLLPLILVIPLIVALAWMDRRLDAMFFAVWVIGAYARALVEFADIPRWFSLVGAAIAVLALLVYPIERSPIVNFALGCGFAVYLTRFDKRERGISRTSDHKLAGFSYSLYVTHLPLMVFLAFLANRFAIFPTTGLPFGLVSVCLIASALVIALLVAWLFGRLFEDRTEAARSILLAAIVGSRKNMLRPGESA
jgi:peptidoglycan/LPS O-acetylase OafA/YrhL